MPKWMDKRGKLYYTPCSISVEKLIIMPESCRLLQCASVSTEKLTRGFFVFQENTLAFPQCQLIFECGCPEHRALFFWQDSSQSFPATAPQVEKIAGHCLLYLGLRNGSHSPLKQEFSAGNKLLPGDTGQCLETFFGDPSLRGLVPLASSV